MKLNRNRFISKGAKVMTMFCFEKSHCDFDLNPRMLNLKVVNDTVKLNICVSRLTKK